MSTRSIPALRIAVVVLAVMLVAALTIIACVMFLGRVSPFTASGSDARLYTTSDTAESSMGGGVKDEAVGDQAMAEAPVATPAGGTMDNTVRYANLSVEVKDIRAAVDTIRSAARAAGGSVQSSDLYPGGSGYYPVDDTTAAAENAKLTGGYLNVKVPDDKLDSFLESIRDAGKVVSESTSEYDVTTQLVDAKSRIPILEAELQTLTAMLARATTVEEELGIRDRLLSITTELESLKAQLAALEDQDAMATVSISLTVPVSALPASSVDVPWFSWYELQQAFANGVGGFQMVIYALITLIVATAPLWIPLAIVLWVASRRSRRPAVAGDAVTPEPVDAERPDQP